MRCLAATLALLAASQAWGETHTYVLAIGNNLPPAASSVDESELPILHYADDDAADFFTVASSAAASGYLLTVLDRPSQGRFPELLPVARPPTLVELRRAVAALRDRFQEDQRRGDDPVLLLFFSGHGTAGGKGPPALAMLDGPLTRETLYDEVLAQLPARYIHILVDACHAEAVVRPRDLDAQKVAVTAEDLRAWAARSTLSRFPHVGAVLATSSGAEAHEWDVYERGVFSHELISGLRGGADINGDGRVEYSELSAFLGAANGEVADSRARLSVVVQPPELNRRAPIFDRRQVHGSMRLEGTPARLGASWIEDERGNRLVDLHTEPGFRVSLALPAGRTLFLRNHSGETSLQGFTNQTVALDSLTLVASTTRARGAVEQSLHRGLFAAEFGPRYYRGFVDHNEEVLPLPVPSEESPPQLGSAPLPPSTPPAARRPRREIDPAVERRTGLGLLGAGAAFTVAGLVLGAFAAEAGARVEGTDLERPAQQSYDRAVPFLGAALASVGVAAALLSVGTWLYQRGRSPRHPPVGLHASRLGPEALFSLGF